jgi:hypothetical protein
MKYKFAVTLFMMLSVFLSACALGQAENTATLLPSITPSPSLTLTVTLTLTSSPSPTPSKQESEEDLKPDPTKEVDAHLNDLIVQHLTEQSATSAVALAEYLKEKVQGDEAWFEFEDRTYGWHPGENRWVRVIEENKAEIDWSLDSAFTDVIAASWMTEDGQFAYIDRGGQEVVVPNQTFPYIGEVSLPEMILMGQKRELAYDEQTGLSLKEYFDLLALNCDDPDKSALVDRMVGWAKEGFVMAGFLDRGFKKERGEEYRSYYVKKPGEKIMGGKAIANDVIVPIVFEEKGEVKVVAGVRIMQEIAYTGPLQQLEITESEGGAQVGYTGTLIAKSSEEAFGNEVDLDSHPLVLTLQLPTVEEQMNTFTGLEAITGPGVADYAVYKAIVSGGLSPEETFALLESEQPRLIWSHTDLVIVNR